VTLKHGVVLLLTLATTACTNRVVSYQPLFARDRALEETFKEGVWASPEPGCAYSLNQPMQAWPECAQAATIGPKSFSRREYLVAGDPLIVQSRFRKRGKTTHYAYTAILPLARDSAGKMTSFKAWAVECGPPDIVGEGSEREVRVTKSPLPGLTVVGDNCTALAPAPVRDASRASQAWSYTVTRQWIRPSRRTDKFDAALGWSVDPLLNLRKVEEAPAAEAPPPR
jgi:hypothetical protein